MFNFRKLFHSSIISQDSHLFLPSHLDFLMSTSFSETSTSEKNAFLDLNKKHAIQNKLFDFHIKKYEILEDLSVNVFEDINFYEEKFSILPFKFNVIEGNFICDSLKLKSFFNFPKIIKGNCSLKDNPIMNWQHFPEEIQGNLFLQNTLIKNLQNFHSSVKGLIYFNQHIDFTNYDLSQNHLCVLNNNFDILLSKYPKIEQFITYKNKLSIISTEQLRNYFLYMDYDKTVDVKKKLKKL